MLDLKERKILPSNILIGDLWFKYKNSSESSWKAYILNLINKHWIIYYDFFVQVRNYSWMGVNIWEESEPLISFSETEPAELWLCAWEIEGDIR